MSRAFLSAPASTVKDLRAPCRFRRTVGDVRLEITILDEGMARVRRLPRGQSPSKSSSTAALSLREVAQPCPVRVRRKKGVEVIETPALRIEICRRSGRLRFTDPDGEILSEEAPLAEGVTAAPVLRFVTRSGEQFYGLGQKIRGPGDTSLRWNGRRREFGRFGNAREKSVPIPGQGDGNLNVPLLVSTGGYGIFFDNPFRHTWSFDDPEFWEAEAAAGEHQYVFLQGESTGAILERFTRLTGRSPMPPRWGLGLVQSKFGYRNWDEVREVVGRYRQSGIPLDAVVLDLYWFGGVADFGGDDRMGSLRWDEQAFPEAERNIAWLMEQGVKLVLIEEPLIDRTTDTFAEGQRLGFLAQKNGVPAIREGWWGRAALLDVTNSAAREWWWSKHHPRIAEGVAGWWLDLGEPTDYDPEAWYAGGDHATVHNLYNREWVRSIAEGYARDYSEERPFILTRSGYAGTQRYGAAIWSNDVMTAFEWLAPQVSAGLNMGLSGLGFWGTDVGGFIGPVASDELYTRWVQFGVFCPLFRPHGQNRPTAPWEFSARTEEICREFVRLRYRLLPYLYGHFREMYETGMPIMRPLVMEWPEDPVVGDLGDQYLFGSSLLVAPMLGPGESRDVYLPEGTWYDFWTHEAYAGGRWLKGFPAPLERIPLFVRAGSVLPMAPVADHTRAQVEDEITFRVFPGEGRFGYRLYQDDGASQAYRRGEFATQEVRVSAEPGALWVELGELQGRYRGMPEKRRVILEVVGWGGTEGTVCWNGREMEGEALESEGDLLRIRVGELARHRGGELRLNAKR